MTTRHSHGFTIVELLIVVVVIAILAAMTIVAYNGIQQRSRETVLQSDLRQAQVQLERHKIDNGDVYPADSATLPKSTSTIYEYTPWSGGFCLTARADGTAPYNISSDSSVQKGPCLGHEYGYPAPAGVNVVAPFKTWTAGNGATIAGDEVTLPSPGADNPRVISPTSIRVDEATSATVSWETRPLATNARFAWTVSYFAENKTTAVANTLGNTSNGHSPAVSPVNQWTPHSYNFHFGPGIHYMSMRATTSSSYSGPVQIRNIVVTLNR